MPVWTVFVTGATGYIGTALCRRFLAEGHRVRALVRPTSRVGELLDLGVVTFSGDIGDRFSLREPMSGVDWVVHAAAELDLGAPPDRMARANVLGSDNLASLANKLGVPRFLSVSSMARWGGSPGDGSLAVEETPVQEPPTRYSATKRAGERAILAQAARGLRVNTVYPTLVYGPPGKSRGANRLLAALYRGQFPFLLGGDRRSSWVFLDDVVDGILKVMQAAPAGRGYLLAGETVTTRQLIEELRVLGGAPAPRFELPLRVARGLFRCAELLSPLGLPGPPMPAEQVASLARHWAFDDRRARQELGFSPRGLHEGLAQTLPLLSPDGG